MHIWTHTHTYNINPPVQTVVDPIVSYNGITSCPNLHPCQRVAMDVIILQNTTPTSKEVHTPLESRKDLVVEQCGVALASDPDPSIRVGINLVLNELSTSLQGNKKRIKIKLKI